jgi:hypothetical protein
MLTIPRPVFVFLSFLVVLGLYYPSLHGDPIWDDFHYIFKLDIITGDFSYWSIFRDAAWPVSVSAEKLIFKIWEYNYFYFHLVNFLIHLLNSFLLLKLVEKFKLPLPRLIFFIFLIHPSNVISVSWMVQLKTLLCFTFCISSFLFLMRALEDKRYYALSWISFALSVLSKSASLPAVLLFLIYSYKTKGKQQLLWMLPFLLISTYSTYKILASSVTAEGVEQIESKSFVATKLYPVEKSRPAAVVNRPDPTPAPAVVNDERDILKKVKKSRRATVVNRPDPTSAPAVVNDEREILKEVKKSRPAAVVNRPDPTPAPVVVNDERDILKEVGKISNLFLKTVHYYFWQIILPLENYPIKGQSIRPAGFIESFHLMFLMIVTYINWGTVTAMGLMSGYLMLLPFLGIFSAPYMNLTWVSEQHLYLALPFFLLFWTGLLASLKFKYSPAIPILFTLFFTVQTFRAIPYYNNEIIFYTKALEADPQNIPIAYNLAVSYLKKNEPKSAVLVTGKIIELGNNDSVVKDSKYFAYISQLHGKIVKFNLQVP